MRFFVASPASLSSLGGQPLDSDLTAVAAIATTAAGRALLAAAAGYVYGTRQIFIASGTWTRPSGCRAVLVRGQGPGGGGGNATSDGFRGAGGSGGGYAEKLITAPNASETITIGAIGAGGTAAPAAATNGGDSSFGAVITFKGGVAGNTNGGAFSAGASQVGGDINIVGDSGGFGGAYASVYQDGNGGRSVLGYGGKQAGLGGGGSAGLGYGGGGGGGTRDTAANRAGGNGAPSIIIVEEFY